MAYSLFSTPVANYIFEAGNHFWCRRKKGVFDGIDAFVTEAFLTYNFHPDYGIDVKTNNVPEGTIAEKTLLTISVRAKEDYLLFFKEKNIPVYSVDVLPISGEGEMFSIETKERSVKKMERSITFLGLSALISLQPFSRGEISEKMKNKVVDVSEKNPTALYNERSVIAAEKISALACKLSSTLGRLPTIGITYGFMHADIITYLQDSERREKMISFYKEKNFPHIFQGQLNILRSYKHISSTDSQKGYWKVKFENMNLFVVEQEKSISQKRRK